MRIDFSGVTKWQVASIVVASALAGVVIVAIALRALRRRGVSAQGLSEQSQIQLRPEGEASSLLQQRVGNVFSETLPLPSALNQSPAVSHVPSAGNRPEPLPISSSFLAYQAEREANGFPVDLIIGRGNKPDPEYPQLLERRFDLMMQSERPYKPFTMDASNGTEPDLCVDCTSLWQMSQIPDNSIDDIFMERIFPSTPQTSAFTYCTVNRILKPGGTFVMDISSLCNTDQVQGVTGRLATIFDECNMPLSLYTLSTERNSLHVDRRGRSWKSTIAFYKTDDRPVLLRQDNRMRKLDTLLTGLRAEIKNQQRLQWPSR